MKKGPLLQLIAIILCILSAYFIYDGFGPNLFWRAGINRLGIPYTYWVWILISASITLFSVSIGLLIWGQNLKQQTNKP